MDISETATDNTAQDITSRLEDILDPSDDSELDETNDDEVLEDGEILPEDDDSDSDDDEGSNEDDENNDDEDEGEQSLADYLGVDDERIIVTEEGDVQLNTIVDGETKAVDLKELVTSYQLQGHVNNKSIALENERKEFETVRTGAAGQLQERLNGIDALSKVLEQQLVADYDSINWDNLRTNDPSEWTALRQEFADRASKIQRAQALILEQNQQHGQEQEQLGQQRMAETLQAEQARMVADNPTWADEAVLVQAQTDIKNFLTSTYNFTDEDMAHVNDHRVIRMIQDAKAFREGKAAAGKKKQKQVPQFKKPGVSKAKAASLAKARNVKAKRAAVKNTGHVRDVATLIEDRM